MPSELRQIVFRPNEVVAAIAEFHQRRRLAIPKGRVVGLHLTEPPEIRATLSIVSDDQPDPIPFTLGSEVLAAALIFYCINRGIPLPALANKKLRRFEDSIGLEITNK